MQHIKDGRIGNYFAPVGTPANHLGINPAGRVPITFAPVKETERLNQKLEKLLIHGLIRINLIQQKVVVHSILFQTKKI